MRSGGDHKGHRRQMLCSFGARFRGAGPCWACGTQRRCRSGFIALSFRAPCAILCRAYRCPESNAAVSPPAL